MAEEKEEFGFVRDTLARHGESRAHEVIVQTFPDAPPLTKVYNLRSDQSTQMPLDHAMKFLVDKAFVVEDSQGNVIKPVAKRDDSLPLRLGENEVVAEYEELSRPALWKRAKVMPGSESLKKTATDEDLIAFLRAAGRREAGVARGSENSIGELDGIDKVIEDSPLIKKKAA